MNTDLIIKKYKKFIYISNVIAAIFSIFIILLPGNILSIPFAFLFYIIVTKLTAIIAVNTIILPVIKQKADYEVFSQILDRMKIITDNATEHIIASYLSGDYQKTLNICYSKLKNISQKRYFHIYYTYIAKCYFDMGNNEKLKETCQQFEQMASSIKHGKEIIQKCTAMRFFKAYLENEYIVCKELYETIISQKDFSNDLLSEIQTKYTYAVACFYAKDLAKAARLFEFISAKTPNLNYAVMSREYLACIKSNTMPIKEPVELQIDCNFFIPKYDSKRKKIGKILLYVGLFISLTAVLIFTVTQTDMSFKLF